MAINSKYIENQLDEIEKEFFSRTIELNGIQLWPIFKDFFYYKQIELITKRPSISKREIYDYPKFFFIRKCIWRFFYLYLILVLKFKLLFSIKKSNFLFFDVMNREYLDVFDGKNYCRYVTPYFEEISKIASTVMIKIPIEEEASLNKTCDSYELKGVLLAKKYFMLYNINNMHYYKPFVFDLLSDIDHSLNLNKESIFRYSDYCDEFLFKIIEVDFYKRISSVIIDHVKPKAIFYEAYFGHPDFAGATLASKLKGVKSIDIQHGTSEAYMYRGFTSVENSFSCILPDYFWTWSQKESECVSKQMFSNNFLKPLHLGKKERFMHQIRETAFDRMVSNIRAKYARVILISFQYNYRQYEFLKDIIEDLGDCFFLLRFHPMDFKDVGFRDHYTSFFSSLNNIEFELTTEELLGKVFDAVDIHLTLNSSAAIDALNYGIRTVLFNSEFASVNYNLYFEKGVFLTYSSIEELKQLIRHVNKLSLNEREYYDQFVTIDDVSKRLNEII